MNPTRRVLTTIATAAAASLTFSACAVAPGSDVDQTADEVTASGVTLKRPCRGMMVRSGPLPSPNYPYINAAVLQVNWSDLERSDQSFDFSALDTYLDAAAARGIAVRLRVLAGQHAPSFVKRLGHAAMSDSTRGIDCSQSGGVAIWNEHDSVGSCSSFFWMPRVIDQYEQLMTAIAARYDAHPALREVVASGCMTTYAEPFYRAHADNASNQRLNQAGLNLTNDIACHQRVLAIHDRVFQHTRTSLAINPMDVIDSTGPDYHHTSWSDVYTLVTQARSTMGRKLVLQNNGWGENEGCPTGGTPESHYYCYLASIGGPKGFQTETLDRLGGFSGFQSAVNVAIGYGMSFIEMPTGWQNFDQSILRNEDAALEANPL